MADTEAPADDLRTLLSQSFDQAAAPEAEPIAAEPAAKVEPAEPEPQADAGDDRPRGPDGKFLKKDEADAKADVAAAKDGGKQQKDEAPAKTPDAEDPAKVGKEADKAEAKADGDKAAGNEPPANWAASDKAMFKLQTPEAQAFLLKTVKNLEAGFTKKSEGLADLRKEYEPIQQLFSPYVDVLKQKGLTPQTVIRRWADVETALANGRGVDIIDGIVKSYGIDKATLAQRLGFTSTGSVAPSTDAAKADPAASGSASPAPIELPPAVAEEIRQLRARLDAREQQEQTAKTQAAREREAAVEADITNFRSAKGADGALLHPYFEEVEQAMIALASSYAASKQPIPQLAELYERAVWANPSTRTAMLAAQKAAEQARQAEEARAKSRQAQRAASSVTGAPGSGQATKQVRGELTLREQLVEAADGL